MSTHTPNAEQLAAATFAAREITQPVTSANRNAVRKYVTALGFEYQIAGRLTLAQLREVAHLATQGAHGNACAYIAGAPVKQEEPAEAPELPTAPQEAPVVVPPGSLPLKKPVAPQPAQTQPQTGPAPLTSLSCDEAASRAAKALQDLIASAAAAGQPQPAELDEARVVALIHEHAKPAEPRTIKIEVADLPAREIPRQHWKFPLLLATIAARVPAYLVGPAGTGKTSAAHAAADALGLPFGAISVGPMTSKGDLFGMIDASGKYHETELVRRARDGGVFLFDEIDAGNPGVITAINMLLANGYFSTPAGMVQRHADFIPIFAMNTYGTGASREYVGRNQLDAATLDRGAFIDWPLDEGLEAFLMGEDQTSPTLELEAGGVLTPGAWLTVVRAYRFKTEQAKVRHIISPRAAIMGARMAAAGIGKDHLVRSLLVKGLDEATAAKIAA